MVTDSCEYTLEELSEDQILFIYKTARSITEIQQSVNNMADIAILLEVLGYNDTIVESYGFHSPNHLANYVYNIIGYYDNTTNIIKERVHAPSFIPIPSLKQRITEALTHISPFMSSLIILYVIGISLWMAKGLSSDTAIALISGVYLGLVFSEGHFQIFSRLFLFYYEQNNIGEVRRIIKRNYILITILLLIIFALVYIFAIIMNIPFEIANIAILSATTLAIHRTSFIILYSTKRFGHIILSYLVAFTVLLSLFYFLPKIIDLDTTTRYLTALMGAFTILSAIAAYFHYKIIINRSVVNLESSNEKIPHFYTAPTFTNKTIKSQFKVQVFENITYFIFGTFFFIALFGDRVLSWILNPEIITTTNGNILPMAFNSTYHNGADLALIIIIPVTIIQYVIASPLYIYTNNKAISLKVLEIKKIDEFLKISYLKLIFATLIVSLITAGILNFTGSIIEDYIGGNETSVWILDNALIGNVFISIFSANSIFIIYLKGTKVPALLSILGSSIIIIFGILLSRYNFENIVIAYILSCGIMAILSSAYIYQIMTNNAISNFFAKFL